MVAIRHEVGASSPSSPEITYGEAELGRRTMVAISGEIVASGSAPEIVVTGEAAIGRETMVAIDADGKPRPTSSPDAIRVELVSMPDLDGHPDRAVGRETVPWVEMPSDSKRADEAATRARAAAAPRLSLHIEDADEQVIAAARAELGSIPGLPSTPSPPSRPKQNTMLYDGKPPKPLPPKQVKR
jgi:hypothetical protein